MLCSQCVLLVLVECCESVLLVKCCLFKCCLFAFLLLFCSQGDSGKPFVFQLLLFCSFGVFLSLDSVGGILNQFGASVSVGTSVSSCCGGGLCSKESLQFDLQSSCCRCVDCCSRGGGSPGSKGRCSGRERWLLIKPGLQTHGDDSFTCQERFCAQVVSLQIKELLCTGSFSFVAVDLRFLRC